MVASQDENREVLSPEAVRISPPTLVTWLISALFCKDYHPTARARALALMGRFEDHRGPFGQF